MSKEKQLGLSNMNGITEDEDKTCSLTDMSCLGADDASAPTVTDMNAAKDQDDLSCDLSNMNCE